MPKVPSTGMLSQSRRWITAVGAENMHAPTAPAATGNTSGGSKSENSAWSHAGASATTGEAKAAEVFWMKDPKTGNWIPENQFGNVDVAELRERVLSRKNSERRTQ